MTRTSRGWLAIWGPFAGQPATRSVPPPAREGRMGRRRLLGEAYWAGVFALPSEEREVVRHCTLTTDDLALVAAKRSPHNRLAYALLLLALRHPGRALEAGEVPPAPMVAY